MIRFLSICFLLLSLQSAAQVDEVSDDKFAFEYLGFTVKIPYYSNYDIDQVNNSIEKVVVVIHGDNRDADVYFDNMEEAANRRPNQTQNTLIIAPQFLTEEDIDFWSLDDEHLYWTSGGWKAGSNSRDEVSNPRPVRLSSYAVLDSLLIHVTQNFPEVETLVFTGHSAGGQVANRMAACSPITDILCEQFDISSKFIVANPSSYVYLNNERRIGSSLEDFDVPNTNCDYNDWKYGLEDLFKYPSQFGVDSIQSMMKRRRVDYILGSNDNNPNSSSLDVSCEANLQGEHRLERGEIYVNYLEHYYGEEILERQSFQIIPGVGHDNYDMYHSEKGLFLLFEETFNSCQNTVAVSEWSKSPIKIFPNPASDYISVEIPSENIGNSQLSVFDLHGKLISSQEAVNTLSLANLTTGAYVLRIRQKEFVQQILINVQKEY